MQLHLYDTFYYIDILWYPTCSRYVIMFSYRTHSCGTIYYVKYIGVYADDQAEQWAATIVVSGLVGWGKGGEMRNVENREYYIVAILFRSFWPCTRRNNGRSINEIAIIIIQYNVHNNAYATPEQYTLLLSCYKRHLWRRVSRIPPHRRPSSRVVKDLGIRARKWRRQKDDDELGANKHYVPITMRSETKKGK